MSFKLGSSPGTAIWQPRDPEDSGLVTIYHPWESGLDYSPRCDAAMAAIAVGDLPPYTRADLIHVADASQRPTQAEYDRYLWPVYLLRQAHYDAAVIARSHPFLVKDVFFSAIVVAANMALLDLADVCDAPDSDRTAIAARRDRGRRGLADRWDEDLGLCLDFNVRTRAEVPVRTIAGFAPLIAGGLPATQQTVLITAFDGPALTGHPDLRWPVPPSTSPEDPAFRPRSYWRGPTWPVITWLFWWSLRRDGLAERAAQLRRAALAQLAAVAFAEYCEPFTGEPLGSADQSWTAAVALDWLASE